MRFCDIQRLIMIIVSMLALHDTHSFEHGSLFTMLLGAKLALIMWD